MCGTCGCKSAESGKKNCGCGQDPCITFGAEWVVEAVQQNLNDEHFVNTSYAVLIGGDAKTFEEKSKAIAETMNQNANNPSFTSFVESELFSAETFEARTKRKSITDPFVEYDEVTFMPKTDTDELREDMAQSKMVSVPDGKHLGKGRYDRHKRKRKGHKRQNNPKKTDYDNTSLGHDFYKKMQHGKEDMRRLDFNAENYSDEVKAKVFDKIFEWHEQMQLQGEGIEYELDRMRWMLENPDKGYDDYPYTYDGQLREGFDDGEETAQNDLDPHYSPFYAENERPQDMSYFFVYVPSETGRYRGMEGEKYDVHYFLTLEEAQKAFGDTYEIYEYRALDDIAPEEREKQKQDYQEWYDRSKKGEFFEDFWWKNEMSRYGNSDAERLHHSTYDSSVENDERDGFYEKTILPSEPSRREQEINRYLADDLGISETLAELLNASRTFGMYISQRAHPDTVKKYRQRILDGFDAYSPESKKEQKIVKMVRQNMATRGVKGPSPSYWSSSLGVLKKPELHYAYDDYYDNPIPFMGYELTDEEKKIIGDVKSAENRKSFWDDIDSPKKLARMQRNYEKLSNSLYEPTMFYNEIVESRLEKFPSTVDYYGIKFKGGGHAIKTTKNKDLAPKLKKDAEYHRDSKGRFAEKPILTGSVIGGLALGLIYLMREK